MLDKSDFNRLFSDLVEDILRSNLAFSFSSLDISSCMARASCCNLLLSSFVLDTSFSILFTDNVLSHILVLRWLFLLSNFCTWLWRSELCLLIIDNSFLTRTLLHLVSASSFCIFCSTLISGPILVLSSDDIWSEDILMSRSVADTSELLVLLTSMLESLSSESRVRTSSEASYIGSKLAYFLELFFSLFLWGSLFTIGVACFRDFSVSALS